MKNVFEKMVDYDHEQVLFCHDKASGLRAIIAIHNSTLGPAAGGVRIWPYESEEEALVDVLRLSKGMTYKTAALGANIGGGKSVIIADPKEKTEEMLRAFGRYINSLGGRYYTAEDVGASPQDLLILREETPFVLGMPHISGDSSPVTAAGVFSGMKASAEHLWGSADFNGKKVAVQGAGGVGFGLVELLIEAGAKVYVSDIAEERVKKAVELGAIAVSTDEIYDVDADIFAPCALGGIINDDTIARLKVEIVCGGANNQLLEHRHGEVLAEKGILYAPDFVVNGGGMLNGTDEIGPGGYNRVRAMAKVKRIYDIALEMFDIAQTRNILPFEAAEIFAEERIEKALRQKRIFLAR